MKLHQTSKKYKDAKEDLDTLDIPEEAINDTLEAIGGEIDSKLIPLSGIKEDNMPSLFSTNGIDNLLSQINEYVSKFECDTSTAKGRKEIARNAMRVSRSKLRIDGFRKELVSKEKQRLKLIDSEGKRFRDACDSIRDQVRKPLDDWEEAEERRLAKEALDREISDAFDLAIIENDLFDRQKSIEAQEAKLAQEAEEKRLKEAAEQKERDRIANEERIKKEAKLAAEREAKEKLELERRESAKREADAIIAKERAEREAKEAIERGKKAAAQAIIDKENAIKKAREDAEQKAKEAEDKRLREEAQAKILARRKAENIEHQKTINNAIKVAFQKNGLSEETSKIIVTAIAKKQIPNLSINY